MNNVVLQISFAFGHYTARSAKSWTRIISHHHVQDSKPPFPWILYNNQCTFIYNKIL